MSKCRIMVSRRVAHKKCDGELHLVNRNTMTYTPSEEEVFEQFQKARDGKMIVRRVPFDQKGEMTKESMSKPHRKSEEKTAQRKRDVLENLYPPNSMTFGDGEKKKKSRKESNGKDKRQEDKENKQYAKVICPRRNH